MGREELNRLGERSSDMKQVANHFLELSASEQDRLLEEHREKSRLVLHNQREYAREEFQRKMREQAIKEGITQGMEKGMKQATEQNMKQVALQMLKEKIDMDLISRVTGITKKKVLKLKAKAD